MHAFSKLASVRQLVRERRGVLVVPQLRLPGAGGGILQGRQVGEQAGVDRRGPEVCRSGSAGTAAHDIK